MIDLAQPLDLDNPESAPFLKNIQGNIIKGHGRDHTAQFILTMAADSATVKSWIREFATTHITTAALAKKMTDTWKANTNQDGEPFYMLLLSAGGYRYLGYTDSQLPVPPPESFTQPGNEDYFKLGMKNQEQPGRPGWRRYNDPPSSQWELPYQSEIHAMVLLADDNEERLKESIDYVTASVNNIFEILVVERGDVIRKAFPRGELVIEHFGFQDGISQPLMTTQDIQKEVSRRGNVHWDPSAPLVLALAKEQAGNGYGSFMVFRKLEQNVAAFWQALEKLSQDHNIPLEQAGAMAVGRFEDGTPAIPTTTVEPDDPNDFHYSQDMAGAKCPFHAHIRKTNPRGDIALHISPGLNEFERARRIVRRGITYGARPDLGIRPSSGVGLLFMCFQSNLDQFVIQQEGSDSNSFVKDNIGVDAVIGQNNAPIDQTWPGTGTIKYSMANFVKMLGGEYFFAPSISFLTSL